MKKFKPDPEYFKKSLYALIVIVCSISFYKILTHIDIIFFNFSGLLKTVRSILSPFIYGFFIAYLLNPAVRMIKNNLLKIKFFNNREKLVRTISALFSFIVIIGALIWIISYLLPEVMDSVVAMFYSVMNILLNTENTVFDDVLTYVNETFNLHYTYREIIDIIFQPLMQALSNIPSLFNKVLTGTMNVAGIVLNFVLGIMIAFYMTIEKENFKRFSIKILRLIFKKETADKIINVASDSNIMFEKFFTGKIIDSIIIGLIFYVISQFLLKLKFSLLFSLIIGVTNVIPYFGPFMGGIPVILIVLLSDPIQGLWVSLSILIIQQFDGIILGPKILGDSTGLRPIDVIFAIIVGGALFGVLGMFLGVPVFAVIKIMVSAFIDKRYNKKYMAFSDDGRLPDVKDGKADK